MVVSARPRRRRQGRVACVPDADLHFALPLPSRSVGRQWALSDGLRSGRSQQSFVKAQQVSSKLKERGHGPGTSGTCSVSGGQWECSGVPSVQRQKPSAPAGLGRAGVGSDNGRAGGCFPARGHGKRLHATAPSPGLVDRRQDPRAWAPPRPHLSNPGGRRIPLSRELQQSRRCGVGTWRARS